MITITGFALFDCSGWSSEVWQWGKVRFRRIDKAEDFFLQKFAKINQITFLNPQMLFQASKINVSWLCLERWHGSGYSILFNLITYHIDIICSFLKQLRVYKIAWKLLKTRFREGGEFRWLIMVVINLLIIVITTPSRICLPRWT